jgi:hypothetical protein
MRVSAEQAAALQTAIPGIDDFDKRKFGLKRLVAADVYGC